MSSQALHCDHKYVLPLIFQTASSYTVASNTPDNKTNHSKINDGAESLTNEILQLYGLTEDYDIDNSSAQAQTVPSKAGKAKPPAKPSKLIADNRKIQTGNVHSRSISTNPTNPANNRLDADAVLPTTTDAKNAKNTTKGSVPKPKQKLFGSNLNLDIYFDKELSLLAASEAAQSTNDHNVRDDGRVQVMINGKCEKFLFIYLKVVSNFVILICKTLKYSADSSSHCKCPAIKSNEQNRSNNK